LKIGKDGSLPDALEKIGKRNNPNRYIIISISSIMIFLLVWEILTDVMHVAPAYALPSPLKVFKSFIQKFYTTAPDGATLMEHVADSLVTTLLGFFSGSVIGIPLGIAMAWSQKIDKIAKTLFDMLRPIPPIAWIPIMIVVFGIGTSARVAVILLAAFVPCVLNSYTGIKQTSEIHIWVARTFGATRRQLLFKVAIPTALPYIFTGIRVSLGASWMALVAAELLASSKGVGYMIQTARFVGRADLIMVGMLVIGFISMILTALLDWFERKFVTGES